MAIFKVTAVPDFSQLKGEIAKLQSSPVTLGVDTRQANVNIKATTKEIKNVGKAAKETSGFAGLMGKSFSRLTLQMATWQMLGNAIAGVKRSFVEALDTMKSVDDEMVTIRKVTGASADELEKIEKRAYKTASAYGVAADEYLQFVSGFSRAGYGEQASALAELAAKTQIVGDTNAETAQQFLLSVDAAYKYQGNIEKLTAVLDGANEIDNRYATSIQKVAEGLGKVAPIAAQAHVGVDELTAAIGTITAVTQRSGTEAATALRALFLNIIGDTKTEIDEGVTWTTGEIAGLRDVIKVYAKDAYDAAQATGSVINPMKAIAGLSKSMKDGLLTEQQLMEMVSDIGGKLRTSQLLALIQHWDMYESMLTDFAGAAGSADKEVENALDSWTRKTEILKNKWTEFVSHLVETDTIKGALDGVIKLVELLDTDFGRAVVTAGAASAALVGVVAAIKAIKKAAAAFSLASLNPWVLGIMAVGAAIGVVLEATKSARKSIADFNAEIADANDKLQTNKTRLEEINAMSWNERTSEILNEKAALEKENEELEKQLDLLDEERKKKAEKETGDKFIFHTGEYKTEEEFVGTATPVSVTTEITRSGENAYKVATEQLTAFANQLDKTGEIADEQRAHFDSMNAEIATQVEWLRVLEANGESLTDEQKNMIAAYEELQQAFDRAVNGQELLVEAYNKVAQSTALTESEYQRLISLYPQLASAATQTADGYIIQKTALEKLMSAEVRQQAEAQRVVNGLLDEAQQAGYTGKSLYDLVAAQITTSNTQLNFSQQIAALRQLAAEAGYATEAYGKLLNEGRIFQESLAAWQSGVYDSMEEARAAITAKAWNRLTGTAPSGGWGGSSYAPPGGGYSGGSGSSGSSKQNALDNAKKKAAQATIDAIRKQMKAETDAIDEQIDAIREKNKEEERSKKLEELKLDILKKQDALLNARNERTVRQYNAATGQWEWVANPEKVKQAQEDLENAKKELREYEADVEREITIAELEARKKAIEAAYQLKIDGWQKLIDQLNGDVKTEKALLAASLGDWDTYYQEMLKVYQGLLDAAEDYQKKMTAIQRQGGGKDDSSEKPSIGAAVVGAVSGAAKPPSNTKPSINTAVVGAVSGAARPPSNKKPTTTTKPSGMGGGSRFNTNVIQKYDSGGILKGLGGIKATEQDEMILPPDITARMTRLSRTSDVQQLFRSMRSVLFGGGIPYGQSVAGTSSTDRHDVTTNNYTVNGVPISQRMAKMPVEEIIAELTGAAHQMRPFSNG